MLALLSLVLLFRTLIPAGYMIAPSGDGVTLTFCEAGAPAASVHHEGHDSPARPKQPCAYAALAAPAIPPSPPLIGTPPSPPDSASSDWIAPTSIAPEPASPPPPSTGPPHRV